MYADVDFLQDVAEHLAGSDLARSDPIRPDPARPDPIRAEQTRASFQTRSEQARSDQVRSGHPIGPDQISSPGQIRSDQAGSAVGGPTWRAAIRQVDPPSFIPSRNARLGGLADPFFKIES